MSFQNSFHQAESLYDNNNDASASMSSENTVDETCRQLLDSLLPRSGGAIFDARVILEFKVGSQKSLWLISI